MDLAEGKKLPQAARAHAPVMRMELVSSCSQEEAAFDHDVDDFTRRWGFVKGGDHIDKKIRRAIMILREFQRIGKLLTASEFGAV